MCECLWCYLCHLFCINSCLYAKETTTTFNFSIYPFFIKIFTSVSYFFLAYISHEHLTSCYIFFASSSSSSFWLMTTTTLCHQFFILLLYAFKVFSLCNYNLTCLWFHLANLFVCLLVERKFKREKENSESERESVKNCNSVLVTSVCSLCVEEENKNYPFV